MSRLGLTGRIIVFALLATGVTALTIGGASIYASYSNRSEQLAEAYPIVLEWGVGWVRGQLSSGQTEIERLAASTPMRGWSSTVESMTVRDNGWDPKLRKILQDALAESETLSSLVVVDQAGEIRAATGSGPTLTGLIVALEPRSARESGLEKYLHAVELRKKLSGVEASMP